ncbi:MAG TPA: hypothetical protein VFJ82_10845 [Longimicrobium sp.]|nr:hypothetical protein [Longimicrobium sp.]
MLQGHFRMRATFPSNCGCGQFQYRQGIKGYFYLVRGGRAIDVSPQMGLPHGRLDPNTFFEDGNTSDVAVNYGHREQPAEPTNHYLDASRGEDQHNGCTYEGEDHPGLQDPAPTRSGDVWVVNLMFQGQVIRNGGPVQTREWTAISGTFPTP